MCRTPNGRLLITVLDYRVANKRTLDDIFRIIVWSLQQLNEGAWPEKAHDGSSFYSKSRRFAARGRPLLGGFRAVLSEVWGDWKFLKETFELKHYANNSVCHLCKASRTEPEFLFTNTRPDAPWRNTATSSTEYLSTFGDNGRPALTLAPHFNLRRIWPDPMHTIDLGVAAHLCGNVIWECVALAPGAGSRNKKLETGWNDYRVWCRQTGIGCFTTCWTVEKLNKKKATNWPYLKAKANEGKWCVAWAATLARRHCDGSEHAKLRAAAAWALRQYYAVTDAANRYLTPSELAAVMRHLSTFLECYAALCAEAQAAGVSAPTCQTLNAR